MQRRSLLLSVSILILVGLSSSLAADAAPGTEWYLVMTWDQRTYNVGEQANITIHVFSEGAYANPPNITFVGGLDYKEINLTRLGTGSYKAVLTIANDDLEMEGLYVFECFINDTDGEALASDRGSLLTPGYEAFLVDMIITNPIDERPRPGQRVEFLGRTTFMGLPVDPDGIVGYLSEGDGRHDLIPTRLAPGLFSFNHTISGGMSESSQIYLRVRANYTVGTTTYDEYIDRLLAMDVLRIWAEVTDRSHRGAALELWVTDMDGEAVEGARVDLEATLRTDGSSSVDVIINETTDAQGRVLFNASKFYRYDFYTISMDGTVTAHGLVQHIDEDVIIEERPKDISSYLLLEEDFDLPLEPGAAYELGFHLEVEGNHTLWSHQTMYVYIYDRGTLYVNERLVTDSNGDFSVTLRAPELDDDEQVRTLHLILKTRGEEYWLGEHDYLKVARLIPYPRLALYKDEQLEMGVGALGAGRGVNVTLRHPRADGVNETAWVYWGPVPMTANSWLEDHFETDWDLWSDWDRTVINTVPCQWNGSAYVGRLTLPAHVPNRVELYLAGVVAFHGPDDWGRATALPEGMVFIAHGPPSVQMDAPRPGRTYSGTMTVTGRAFDDVSVVRVEVLIDELESRVAKGTAEWSLALDTIKMGHGVHKIGARAFDGTNWSEPVEVMIHVNQPPEITGVNIPDDEFVRLPFNLTGKVIDDDGMASVTVTFEDTCNVTANGTHEWWVVIDEQIGLSPGVCSMYIIAIDSDGAEGRFHSIVEIGTGGPIRVAITYPAEGEELVHVFDIEGRADPTGGVERVEVRVNGGTWWTATGTNEWELEVSASSMAFGSNLIEARAYDGQNSSTIYAVNITFDGIPRIVDFQWKAGTDSILFNGTATDDGDQIAKVEMCIDGRVWIIVNGTTSWDHEVDAGELTHGSHYVLMRAYDGNSYSWMMNWTFVVNHRPQVEVIAEPSTSEDGAILTFNGNATDSHCVTMVSYRVDEGQWVNITTSGAWSFELDTGQLEPGTHTVEVRAYDGEAYSDTYTYTFEIGGSTEQEVGPPLLVIGVATVATLMLVVVMYRYMRGSKGRGA